MRYLSVCSGIEAASVAWEPLGWEAAGFSEIEPFPAAVLKHRYPNIINHGDMTKHEQWNIPSGTIDLLAGGTPCQSFSVAGLRQGIHDPRGGLMLTFLEIAQRLRPRWIVWENVPGVLSSNGGRDFGSFLGALGELGFGWAYRILDAQWFGVAQRRRRVFVVGCLGDQDAAAKVLFERESVCRDTPPGRKTGQGTAADAEECAGGGDEQLVVSDKASHWEGSRVHPTLNQSFNTGAIGYSDQEIFSQGGAGLVQSVVIDRAAYNQGENAHAVFYENHPHDSRVTGPHEVAPSCVSKFGTGGDNVPLVQAVDVAVAFQQNTRDEVRLISGDGGIAGALSAEAGMKQTNYIMQAVAVRRLTPREAERLQGFPDDWTLIPWRGKPADQCPDGPRYKALGNSMAVPCMAWIGKRIADFVAQTTKGETK
jgi:DNA (cytosine-5)-methyltransferase 1